jgi:threonine/homoserine/homoserine lactone efflux protein
MSLDLFLAYVLACIVLALIPGPTVTLIIANSLRHRTRAGLANVAGTQLGLVLMISVVGFGLSSLMETLGHWFDWLRLIGAAYLAWLGIRMLRAPAHSDAFVPAPPRGGFALQGFLVAISNPKTLAFFGAFLPQFLDPHADHLTQIVVMGATFLVIAAASDSAFALFAGRAGVWLSLRRQRLVTRVGAGALIAGAAWLAFSRSR